MKSEVQVKKLIQSCELKITEKGVGKNTYLVVKGSFRRSLPKES